MFARGWAEVDMSEKCTVYKLTSYQNTLHQRALDLSRKHRKIEFLLVEVLQEIDHQKLYRAFECTSLFKYAVDVLELTEAVAFAFIAVARAAKEVAVLQETQARRVCRCAKSAEWFQF